MGFFFIPFIGAFVSAMIMIARRFAGEIDFSDAPEEALEAVVVSKRMHLTGGDHAATLYYATFELADDRRIELALDGSSYGSLAEGDIGVLTVKGSRFVSFRRTDDRFDARGAGEREHKCEACGAPFTGKICPYCGTPAK